MSKNILCRHCQNPCKKTGLIQCEKYNAKSNRPQQLADEIKKAFKEDRYKDARLLKKELDGFLYGDVLELFLD